MWYLYLILAFIMVVFISLIISSEAESSGKNNKPMKYLKVEVKAVEKGGRARFRVHFIEGHRGHEYFVGIDDYVIMLKDVKFNFNDTVMKGIYMGEIDASQAEGFDRIPYKAYGNRIVDSIEYYVSAENRYLIDHTKKHTVIIDNKNSQIFIK